MKWNREDAKGKGIDEETCERGKLFQYNFPSLEYFSCSLFKMSSAGYYNITDKNRCYHIILGFCSKKYDKKGVRYKTSIKNLSLRSSQW